MRAMASPRSGCRGTITVSSDGKIAGERPVRFRSGSPPRRDGSRPRPRSGGRASSTSAAPACRGSAGGAGTSSLRLPVVTTLRLPSAAKRSASICDCARQTSNLPSSAEMVPLNPPPARKRAMRHPSVDQHHRQPPRRARQDQIRPQIGFDEQRQRRPPVIEKARDITRRIVGHILMDDVGRKPLGDDRRRGHRARGQQDAQIQRAQPLDQRGGRQHFADAGAVNPDQRPVRAGRRRSCRGARRPAPDLPCRASAAA